MRPDDTKRYYVTYCGMSGVPHTRIIRASEYTLTDRVRDLLTTSEDPQMSTLEWAVVTSPDYPFGSSGHPILMLMSTDEGFLVTLNKTTYSHL